jgi:DNA polymerase-3 subunit delta'
MNTPSITYPWLARVEAQLSGYLRSQRLPHALLIYGKRGIGKSVLLRWFAKTLLCEQSQQTAQACHACQSCLLFEMNNHPDYHALIADETSKLLTIDQIRTLNQELQLVPQYNQYRVVLIQLAESLNVAAANSFLKTLEEPGQRTVFLLASDNNAAVLPTIKTRCQQLKVVAPGLKEVSAWLSAQQGVKNADVLAHIAGGSPLHAMQLLGCGEIENKRTVLQLFVTNDRAVSDIVSISEQWVKFSSEFVVYILITGIFDMIRLRMFPTIRNDALYHPDQRDNMAEVAKRCSVTSLFGFLDRVYQLQTLLMTQVNKQSLYEACFIQWNSSTINQ